MSLEMLVIFFLITLTATATPGPTMLYIASSGLDQGVRGYIAAGSGVLVADFIYFFLTITGLNAILIASYELFFLIKWLGVIYLIYLGLKIIFSKSSTSIKNNNISVEAGLIQRFFIKGFIIHLANPKTILFFSALLPQFINTEEPLFYQAVIIGTILMLTQAGMSIVYGEMANRLGLIYGKTYSGKSLTIVSGILLIVAGIWLATVRRP